MLRSCLFLLAAYAVLFAAYVGWLGEMFDPPGVYIGAGVVALIVGGCLGTLYNARVAYREWSLVAAARHGMPSSDGRWTAIAGEIHPVTEPLIAPFSGEPCVLCEYDITSRQRASAASQAENSNPGSDFAGFLMNPCVIRGLTGELRLLGFPNLVGFGERVCRGSDVAHNAREFLTGTQFEDFSGLKLVTVFSAIKAAWSDDDGLVRKNLRLGKMMPEALFPHAAAVESDQAAPPPPAVEANVDAPTAAETSEDVEDDDLDDECLSNHVAQPPGGIPQLKEKRVKVGEHVCAIGIYSGERRGLVPGGLGADHFIKLIRGRAADIERQARGSTFGRLFGGLVALVLVHVATFGVMLAARYDPKQHDQRQQEAFKIANDQTPDVHRLVKMIGRGVDINARDGQGRTLLAVTQNPALARWLIEHGADVNAASEHGRTPLMEAARRGDKEIVQLLLKAKADVHRRSPNDGDATALTFAEREGNGAIAELLRQAGANDETATTAEQLPVVGK
jgi:ankyrin repeat protein